MQENEADRFNEIMYGLAENYSATVTGPGLLMKFQALRDLEIEDIAEACVKLVQNRKFSTMPNVAEIRETATGTAALDVRDTAQIEATKVLQAIQRVGGYRSVCFDDPVTQAVIGQGYSGWPKMCTELMVDDEKWFLIGFAKLYVSFAKGGIKKLGHLPGCSEIENSERGIQREPAMKYIGDREKAKQIEAGAEKPQIDCAHGKLIELAGRIG